jgi:hypothetical protein
MALPNDKRSLQDRLSRVATRMAQKFGNGLFTGVTAGAGASAGIPVSVLVNRIAGKKVSLDSLGRENASALSFTVIDTALGTNAATQDHLVVQTYIPSQMPVGIYGSPTALAMLAKLKAGVDSVDIHVIGDSNAGNPSSGQGWQTGLARGLMRGCCASMYATGVLPVIIHPRNPVTPLSGAAPVGNGGSYKYTNNYIFDGATSDASASGWPAHSGASMQSGTFYAPSDLKVYWNIPGDFRMAQSYTADFAWLPNTGLTFHRGESSTALDATRRSLEVDGIDTRNALTYRVVHALTPNSTGSFPLFVYGWSAGGGAAYNAGIGGYTFPPTVSGLNSYLQAGKRISTAGATGITASFLTWAADSGRYGVTIGFNWYGYGVALLGATWAKGPLAVYLESMHGNTKGWAINLINYHGGATTTTLANTTEQLGTAQNSIGDCSLRTICRETRERQIQAGGSGNVIVFVNSGINDTGPLGTSEVAAAAAYKSAIQKIVNTYKTVWDGLGYPENDLAFLISVTHPNFLTPSVEAGTGLYDWNLDSVRDKGKEYAQTSPDANVISPYSNVTFVNLTQLGLNGITQGGLTRGNAFNSNQNFYNSDGQLGAHLIAGASADAGTGAGPGSTGGYAYLGELMINRCLRYVSSIG